jgi:uncharacterized protein YecE (DUF72 family)
VFAATDWEEYRFRDIHPKIFLGTASDRYAGWVGQVYSQGRYEARITRRSKSVGGQTFTEEVLPVESVEEYFEHFRALEIDFTFYRPLLDPEGNVTQNHHVLRQYRQHLRQGDRLILKVPQTVTAQKVREGRGYRQNEAYLNARTFTAQFYEPAVELLGSNLAGLVFEQEYQRKQDRTPVARLAESLDAFFQEVPRDPRYHVELRTEPYLAEAVFQVLERHGVGQVLSHWTWLPPLRKQFSSSGERFLNGGGSCVMRLMTPRGTRYEDAYGRAHPFDRLVEGMLQPEMIEDAARIVAQGVRLGVEMHVIVNNRAGGNAPQIARQLAERFLSAL